MTDEELKKTQDNYIGRKEDLVQSFDSPEINDKEKATTKEPVEETDGEETDRNETDNIEDVSGTFSSKGVVVPKFFVLGLLLFIVVLMGIWGLSKILGDSDAKLTMANEAIETLYLDNDQQYLKENITEEDFIYAQEVIDSLSSKNKTDYQIVYDKAHEKFKAITALADIFQTDSMLINGKNVKEVDSLLLQPSVTKSMVDEATAAIPADSSDALINDIQRYYTHASDVLIYAAEARSSFESLPTTISSRDDLLELINNIQAIELQLEDYKLQPQVQAVMSDLQTYANHVGDVITSEEQTNGEFDLAFWDEVGWTDTLVAYFSEQEDNVPKYIALTFDDGPNNEFTPQLLDILAKHDVKATFFVMGAYVDEYPEVARRIVNEGHMIGNHTYNHPDLSTLEAEDVLTQFLWTQESIEDVTGVWPTVYRLPFGAGGKRVIDIMDSMTSILWNIDSMDWHYHDTELTYNHIMANLQNDSLLLMHDTHQATPDVIDLLIPVLKDMGYQFVFADEVSFNLRYFAE